MRGTSIIPGAEARTKQNTDNLCQKFPEKKDEFDNFRKRQLNFRAWKLEKVMEEIMENHGI